MWVVEGVYKVWGEWCVEGGDRSTHMRCNSQSHAGTRVLYPMKTFVVETLTIAIYCAT